jgi:hypothetical protein
VGEREQHGAMRRERSTQLADAQPKLDQVLDLAFRIGLAAHSSRVDLFELLLHALERGGMLAENPFEQARQECCTVEITGPP